MQHLLDNFGEFIRPNTVTAIIHNGVDTHRFRPHHENRAAIRQSLGLPQDALVMGTVARLAIDKRPKSVLSVFAKLKEKYSNLYFVWVGAGPLAEEMYREVSRRGLWGSFVFAGFHNARVLNESRVPMACDCRCAKATCLDDDMIFLPKKAGLSRSQSGGLGR